MILLQLSDFKAQYSIPDRGGIYTSPNLQSYIDGFEKQYLNQLLGVDLSNKIIAYLPNRNTTPNPDYNYIIDPFQFQESGGGCCGNCIHDSKGMKAFLVAGIYYEYINDSLKYTQIGASQPQSETSDAISPYRDIRLAERKWNKILDTIEAIQWYCWNNSDKYPTFAGCKFHVKLADIL